MDLILALYGTLMLVSGCLFALMCLVFLEPCARRRRYVLKFSAVLTLMMAVWPATWVWLFKRL